MTFIHEKSGKERAKLAVLDATDMSQAPVALVDLPARIPFGFHGNWVPTA